MQIKKLTTVLAAASSAAAQSRPDNTSICDYYTTALLANNTAENQYTLLTLLVNTVVIGNYTKPNTGVAVPGILAPGTYNGTAVNLAPYFNGALASTNRGGKTGVSVNFLDGGGAAPLMENMPANDTTSNQSFLLTHLYSYFGGLLQCSMYSKQGFPAYNGSNSMYETHKFMALGNAEVGYFITQVALAAQSFGVATSDIQTVGTALNSLFGTRCSPEMKVIPEQLAALQAICIEPECPLAENAVCGQYDAVTEPMNATMTMTAHMGTGTMSATPMGTATMPATASRTMTPTGTMAPSMVPTAAAGKAGLSMMAVAGGFAALML